MRIATFALVGILGLVVVACGGAPVDGDTSPPVASNVRGVVLLGPMCPVVRENSPCPDRPIQARLRVTSADGASFVADTDEEGRFHLTLEPGRYAVHAVDLTLGRSSKPTTFEVPPSGPVVDVVVLVDSGIR
jgi:hypothetical protein